ADADVVDARLHLAGSGIGGWLFGELEAVAIDELGDTHERGREWGEAIS
ncbi:MAG: hypothetical protein GY953_43225, partial [bacterium]|nr:hypothetical protein [bacterium]